MFLIFSKSKLLQGQFLGIAYYRFSICTVRSKHISCGLMHCTAGFFLTLLKKFPIMCSHSPTLRMRLIIIVKFFFRVLCPGNCFSMVCAFCYQHQLAVRSTAPHHQQLRPRKTMHQAYAFPSCTKYTQNTAI